MNQEYLTSHLLNYLGNKRKLLDFINTNIIKCKKILNKDKIVALDGFSGSGSVSRLLKYHSSKLYSNDLETYAFVLNSAYLSEPSEEEIQQIHQMIDELNNITYDITDGIIRTNYAPVDENNITKEDRVFYTVENALLIDNIRECIKRYPEHLQKYALAQLIIKASIHANTSGVFKGFYKNKAGYGQYGGEAKNCLTRILKKIELEYPILERTNTEVITSKEDINTLINNIDDIDIAYYDPPYNQHPYSTNYNILNTIIENELDPKNISKVSGIRKDCNRSDYNYKKTAMKSMKELVDNTKAKIILISYNNEGIISSDDWKEILKDYTYKIEKQQYNTFRGSRNLKNRKKYVEEQMYIIYKNVEPTEPLEPVETEKPVQNLNDMTLTELKKYIKTNKIEGYKNINNLIKELLIKDILSKT